MFVSLMFDSFKMMHEECYPSFLFRRSVVMREEWVDPSLTFHPDQFSNSLKTEKKRRGGG